MSVESLTSTAEIFQLHDRAMEIYQTSQARREIKENTSRLLQREKQNLSTTSICPLPALGKDQTRIDNLKKKKLQKISKDQFYNPEVMRETMCITDAIVYTQPVQKGSVTSLQRTRQWIRNLRQIGTESVYGYALAADLEGEVPEESSSFPMYVLKAPRSEEADEELTHELFIGLFGTNPLRSFVPNFAYVYGGFQCAGPIIDPKTRQVATWCTRRGLGSVNYVIYENIAPSVSFHEYVQKCSPSQFWVQYLQILYALRQAQSVNGFTHYDLHSNNVLIRQIDTDEEFSIPYNTENGREYLKTDRIATIIDYGNSYIVYEAQNYGSYGKESFFVSPRRSYPFHDAYKLLLLAISNAKSARNLAVVEEGIRILSFFNSSPTKTILEREISLAYSLPYTEKAAGKTLDDLLRYIRSRCPCEFITIKPTTRRVLGCSGTDLCLTSSQLRREVDMETQRVPVSLFGFYDIATRYSAQNDIPRLNLVKNQFHYPEAKERALDHFNSLQETLELIALDLETVKLVGRDFTAIFDIETLSPYRQFVMNVAGFYDTLEQLSISYDVLTYAAQTYKDGVTLSRVRKEYKETLDKYLDRLAAWVTSIINDIVHLNRYFIDETLRRQYLLLLEEDPRLSWYEDGLILFTSLEPFQFRRNQT